MLRLLAPCVAILLLLSPVALASEDPVPVAGRTAIASFDERGIADVRAATFIDAMHALGQVHADERFLQMDGARRRAAGELAALFGPSVVRMDEGMRPLGLRAYASEVVAGLPPFQRAALDAYVAGVNAALAPDAPPIGDAPFYGILRQRPQAWTADDSVLVLLGMFDALQGSAGREATLAPVLASLPDELRAFLGDQVDRYDELVIPDPTERATPIPSADVIDLRTVRAAEAGMDAERFGHAVALALDREAIRRAVGSNAWVVSGAHTASGAPLLASDPHLQLMLPNIWYRARISWTEPIGNDESDVDAPRFAVGLTLPGTPGLVIGSNGAIAWGLTNTTGDFQDLIAIERDPEDPTRYRTPDGWDTIETRVERIEIAGGDVLEQTIETTRWGPITRSAVLADGTNVDAVLQWVALRPEAIDFGLLELAEATTVAEVIERMATIGMPSQNVVLADRDGSIGWVISGWLPDRAGRDGRVPLRVADGDPIWPGALPESERPSVIDPANGVIVTANQRTVAGSSGDRLGYDFASPVRAARIRERLQAAIDDGVPLTVDAMHAIQFDTFLIESRWWRALVLDLSADLDGRAFADDDVSDDAVLARVRRVTKEWDGRATADAVAPSLFGAIRSVVIVRLSQAIRAWSVENGRGPVQPFVVSDEPWRRLVDERPAHWLPGDASDWKTWLRESVVQAARRPGALAEWGVGNVQRIAHPAAELAPGPMRGLLELPSVPMDGHWNAPKVLLSSFGASARLVVSPGREDEASLQTPGGQSGSPSRPHFRDLHEAWFENESMPLLPEHARTTRALDVSIGR